MLSDAMDYFGLGRELDQAGYFDTEHHRYLVREIMTAIKKGRVIVLTGIVGCGKTKVLQQIRTILLQDQMVAVARSLAVDKARVNHDILMRALCYQLATDDQARQFPKAPEDRELRVVEPIRQRARPAVLFVDDGHDIPARRSRASSGSSKRCVRRGRFCPWCWRVIRGSRTSCVGPRWKRSGHAP